MHIVVRTPIKRLLCIHSMCSPFSSIEDSLPWDRIRQNAHGQREKMLQSVEAAFAAFWSEAEHLWVRIGLATENENIIVNTIDVKHN